MEIIAIGEKKGWYPGQGLTYMLILEVVGIAMAISMLMMMLMMMLIMMLMMMLIVVLMLFWLQLSV